MRAKLQKKIDIYKFFLHILSIKCKMAYFCPKNNKKYIYTMYIYSKRYIFYILRFLSYGNPMGMVWESYGAGR